ncbi:septum formation initiator family protein, partial [Bacillus sp. D-CC]
SLKKDKDSLKTNIENLTDDEEEILKLARKEYQFSNSSFLQYVIVPCTMTFIHKKLHPQLLDGV